MEMCVMRPRCVALNERSKKYKLCGSIMMLAVLLSGCGAPEVTGSVPLRYDERHPIIVGNGATIVDVYMGAGGFDKPALNRIRGFAMLHHEKNGGPIDINFPRSAEQSPRLKPIVEQIEKVLADNQITTPVNVRFYDPADVQNLAPIRLSFIALTAAVPHACGSYPSDLINAKEAVDHNNQQYYDFGCSSQTILAAQISNPADLKSPREESRPDLVMRTRAIGKIREGTVTATGVN
jgi:pilus assembly protein CpaD